MQQQHQQVRFILIGAIALMVAIESVACVITVQIGGATRLTSINRQRDRVNCYWDCDLVSCSLTRDDDECAYDCEKICRVRYDYATVGRSGSNAAGSGGNSDLKPKSSATSEVAASETKEQVASANELPAELLGAGTSVRLHLPRNASARNFAIWERCAADSSTGQLTEKPFSL